MRILRYSDFHIIESVKLNREGKKIAELAVWNGNIVYLTIRRESHYFVRYNGFGLSKTLIRKMIAGDSADLLRKVRYIILFYDGVYEKRFYLSTPEQWFESNTYGTAKDVGDAIEDYGEQKILSMDEMQLLGVDPRDKMVIRR